MKEQKVQQTGGSMLDPGSPFAGMSGFILQNVGYPSAGVEEKRTLCDCPDCRAERLSQESPENRQLLVQWENFKSFLVGKNLLRRTQSGFVVVSPLNIIEKSAAEFNLDPRLRDIFLNGFSDLKPENVFLSLEDILGPDVFRAISSLIKEGTVKTETASMNTEELENFLNFCQSKGALSQARLPHRGKLYSMEDLLQKRDELPGPLIEILEKYMKILKFK
jgi:hypothetical protein